MALALALAACGSGDGGVDTAPRAADPPAPAPTVTPAPSPTVVPSPTPAPTPTLLPSAAAVPTPNPEAVDDEVTLGNMAAFCRTRGVVTEVLRVVVVLPGGEGVAADRLDRLISGGLVELAREAPPSLAGPAADLETFVFDLEFALFRADYAVEALGELDNGRELADLLVHPGVGAARVLTQRGDELCGPEPAAPVAGVTPAEHREACSGTESACRCEHDTLSGLAGDGGVAAVTAVRSGLRAVPPAEVITAVLACHGSS